VTQLYLIRHAHTQADPVVDAAHWALSATGQVQAAALAALPFWDGVARILVSSEAKTRLTVAPVLTRRTLPVSVDGRFDEVQRPGWVEDYAAQVQAALATPAQAIGGWEPVTHALHRFLAGLAAHLAPVGDAPVALVSHGLVLTAYCAYLRQQWPPAFTAWQQLGFAAVALVDLSGPTLLEDF